MKAETARRMYSLASQLSQTLMTAAICAQEIQSIARANCGDDPEIESPCSAQTHFAGNTARPLVDESTLSVFWNGRTLHLGHTRVFRLLERLARRPNQYVTHLDLLRDVWEDEELATATIRSLVRELRRKLSTGGLPELASAIQGHNGRYILRL